MAHKFLKKISREERDWAIFRAQGAHGPDRLWHHRKGRSGHELLTGKNALEKLAALESAGMPVARVNPDWLVWPTGFDLQVHMRFPGQEDRETLEGGLASAFIGGFDTVVTMPNTDPFLDRADLLLNARLAAEKRINSEGWPLRVLFTAAATEGLRGEKTADIGSLVQAGAVAITDDGWGVREPEAMRRALELCAAADVPFLQHAEMPGHKGHASESAFQKQFGVRPYPRDAESKMVARDLELLELVPGARYHVLHISTRETLEEVRKGKEKGLRVTCEVSPHHLFFDNTKIPAEGDPLSTAFKMNPPLFSPTDREALIDALAEGLIDCVSTDHAPHSTVAKKGNWNEAPFGTRGMETELSVLTTLMGQGRISEERARDAFVLGGRRVLGVAAPQPTGLLVINPDCRWKVRADHLPGISENSCFVGATLQGRIEQRFDGDQVSDLSGFWN